MAFRETELIIRRINRILEGYALKFGKGYSGYKEILNSLNMNEIATRINNKGVIQIQRGKINQNLNKWQLKELAELAKRKTAVKIYKEMKKSINKTPLSPINIVTPQQDDEKSIKNPFTGETVTDPVLKEFLKKEKYPILDTNTGKIVIDPVLLEILKKDYVKENNDIFYYISDQIKAGLLDKLSDDEKALYNRAAGRSDEMTYDELYDLIHAAKGD